MGNELTLRHYGTKVGDYQMVGSWYSARHEKPWNETLVPPLGVICEYRGTAVLAVFSVQALGIGMAIMDSVISKPLVHTRVLWEAFRLALKGTEKVLSDEGYGLLRCFPDSPVLARLARRFGFKGDHHLAKTIH